MHKPPATADQPPMAPGIYIRLRRKTACLSIDDVAMRLGADAKARAALHAELQALENGEPGSYHTLVWRLIHVFPLDPHVYLALVGHAADPGSELPCPRICRICGCSWNDCCRDGERPCGWIDGTSDLCTACAPEPGDPDRAADPAQSPTARLAGAIERPLTATAAGLAAAFILAPGLYALVGQLL